MIRYPMDELRDALDEEKREWEDYLRRSRRLAELVKNKLAELLSLPAEEVMITAFEDPFKIGESNDMLKAVKVVRYYKFALLFEVRGHGSFFIKFRTLAGRHHAVIEAPDYSGVPFNEVNQYPADTQGEIERFLGDILARFIEDHRKSYDRAIEPNPADPR